MWILFTCENLRALRVKSSYAFLKRPPDVFFCEFNSIWWNKFLYFRPRSTLAQVMTCCLTAPSHYLNQFWFIIKCVFSVVIGRTSCRGFLDHALTPPPPPPPPPNRERSLKVIIKLAGNMLSYNVLLLTSPILQHSYLILKENFNLKKRGSLRVKISRGAKFKMGPNKIWMKLWNFKLGQFCGAKRSSTYWKWGKKISSRCWKWGAKPRRIPTDSQRGSILGYLNRKCQDHVYIKWEYWSTK